jgi:alpha-L-rhamnosidase
MRQEDGSLVRTDNHTETCQYYAFYFRTATPETYPELWQRMATEFGPVREKEDKYPDVPKANALFGNYLRMELLSENGLGGQSLKEFEDFYLPMAEATGTLWENMTFSDSCNHGFAAHVAHVLYRDAAGLYNVDRVGKTVTLRLRDTGLKECHAVLPVNEGEIKLDWTCSDGKFDKTISLPKGWKLIEE